MIIFINFFQYYIFFKIIIQNKLQNKIKIKNQIKIKLQKIIQNPQNMFQNSFKRIVNKYNTFLFDCDGVIWQGGKKIQQGFAMIEQIKQNPDNRIFFVSNNCTRSREFIQERLQGFGYDATIEQIHLSSSLIAQNISQNHPDVKKVYAMGEKGLITELENEGLQVMDSKIHSQEKIQYPRDPENNNYVQDIDAIVLGHDSQFNSYKIMYVANLLLNNPKLKFFATENTLSYIKNRGQLNKKGTFIVPGVGSFLLAIQNSLSTIPEYNFKYEMVAKPETLVLKMIQKKYNIEKKDMIMIGDNLTTDIQMSRNYDIDSFLVFTGETTSTSFNNYYYSKIVNDQSWLKYLKSNSMYIQNHKMYPIQQVTGI